MISLHNSTSPSFLARKTPNLFSILIENLPPNFGVKLYCNIFGGWKIDLILVYVEDNFSFHFFLLFKQSKPKPCSLIALQTVWLNIPQHSSFFLLFLILFFYSEVKIMSCSLK